MSKKPNIIAIIPARGGSKRIPRKNIRLLAGKPLISYTINQAKHSKLIDRVIVSTEDKEISRIARKFGAEVIMRPHALATDQALTEPVLQHVVADLESRGYDVGIIVLLQVTCPLRKKDDIDNAIKVFLENEADAVLTVFKDKYYQMYGEISADGSFKPNYDISYRGSIEPKYHEIGSIYVIKRDLLMEKNTRVGGKVYPYAIDKRQAVDIDDEFAFWLVEDMIKQNKFEFLK